MFVLRSGDGFSRFTLLAVAPRQGSLSWAGWAVRPVASGGPRPLCDLWLHSQERINCLEGTHEFFEAIGFQKALLPVPDQGKGGRAGSWLCWEGVGAVPAAAE